MPDHKERLIERAIEEVEKGASIKPTAAKYGVPRSTLQDRLHGAVAKPASKQPRLRLSPEQETFLEEWVLYEEASGRAPGRKRVREMANAILLEGGDEKGVGARWIDRYISRHPDVKIKPSHLLERARARGSTRQAYESFFDLLEQKLERWKILPRHIANMDEHGVQEGESAAGKVLGTSLSNRTYVTSSDATAWVTIIECGTAEGHRLTPCLIFTGASLQGQWFTPDFKLDDVFPGWKYDHMPIGWINNTIAIKWLREIYLPETKPKNPAEWRLLILDEHSTHT